MPTIALSGNDSLIINNRNLVDFADGNAVELKYPNDIAQVKTGKNGNSIFALNESGRQCELMVRMIRGSADDKYLNNLLVQQQANFAGFPLMIGEFIKQLGDGAGNIQNDTYILGSGIFQKQVEAKMNVEGDVDQSVSIYAMKFALSPRAIT